MALDGKQLKQASVANEKLATASSTASTNAVVLSNGDAKIDIGYLPTDALVNLITSSALIEEQLVTLQTSVDHDPVAVSGLSSEPRPSGLLQLYLNGVGLRHVSYGVRTGSLYFSNDDGETAALRSEVTVGTKLFWNGSVAEFQLQAGWTVKVVYLV